MIKISKPNEANITYIGSLFNPDYEGDIKYFQDNEYPNTLYEYYTLEYFSIVHDSFDGEGRPEYTTEEVWCVLRLSDLTISDQQILFPELKHYVSAVEEELPF
jgi:hypothetical protein